VLDHKFGLSLSLGKITLLFDSSLDLDRTLAQRKAKSKVKDSHRPVLSGSQFVHVDCGMQVCREQFVSLHSQPVLANLSKSLLDHFGYTASDIA